MLIWADSGRRTRGRSVWPMPAAPRCSKPCAAFPHVLRPALSAFRPRSRGVDTFDTFNSYSYTFFIHTHLCMYAKGVGKRVKRVKRVNKNDNMRHAFPWLSEKTALTYIGATNRDIFFRRFWRVFPFHVRQNATTFALIFWLLSKNGKFLPIKSLR